MVRSTRTELTNETSGDSTSIEAVTGTFADGIPGDALGAPSGKIELAEETLGDSRVAALGNSELAEEISEESVVIPLAKS